MQFTVDSADAAILQEIGSRLARLRIESHTTQAALAERAGVAKRTLERIEAGRGCELATLIRLLRSLNALDGLERLVPAQLALPVHTGRDPMRPRQRAPRRHFDSPSKYSSNTFAAESSPSSDAAHEGSGISSDPGLDTTR